MDASTKMIQVTAYAKINTFLEVTGRREDGYHTLLSYMQAVTLCDILKVTWTPEARETPEMVLSCDKSGVPCDDTNLICRAASALLLTLKQQGTMVGGCWTFALEKRIPMAAGLAGGSADAAAALRGVNQLLGEPLTIQQLCEIGATIGADVPFCLRCGEGAMTARGIGEGLERAPTMPGNVRLVISCCGEGVSTPWAFRRLDACGIPDPVQVERKYCAFVDAVYSQRPEAIAAASYNCFERIVMPERPMVAKLKDCMQQKGACFALMSGSGPSVVGYFTDQQAASECAEYLRAQGIVAHLCQPLLP